MGSSVSTICPHCKDKAAFITMNITVRSAATWCEEDKRLHYAVLLSPTLNCLACGIEVYGKATSNCEEVVFPFKFLDNLK